METVGFFVPYGTWSKSENLNRFAISLALDAEEINYKIKPVIDKLRMDDLALPFPNVDNYELWLLDREQYQPIVILSSSITEEKTSMSQSTEWYAVNADMPALAFNQEIITTYKNKYHSLANSAASTIYSIIKNAAGHPPVAQWFKREKLNSIGMHGIRVPNKLVDRKISNEQFPLLQLTQI